MPWEAYLTIALLPGFFAGLFVVIGRVSGWAKLAERYLADREPDEGVRFRGQDLRIGWFWNYSTRPIIKRHSSKRRARESSARR